MRALQSPDRPERVAAAQPQRRESIRPRQFFEAGDGDAGAQPEVADGAIASAPPVDDDLDILFRQPFDLAQAEPQRLLRFYVRNHRAMPGMDMVPYGPAIVFQRAVEAGKIDVGGPDLDTMLDGV